MSTYLPLQTADLKPEIISRITTAYEQALHMLCVKDRDDPEMVARNVIKIAQTGDRDPAEIAALAIRELR
ncbi:hypothetical protein [Bradyrhizobium sp. CCBAU 53380]|uniref:hypothetical protein n=1 Tax=Bradyrhizobium sp. CCBAU 53380 TaxID=1325117 RepID=UPI002304BCA8|nr:hypothetical protein [Bradyrhizobium sp. CCBAU 53380]MDA9427133.1 hypothetical protein [Bradyrhizobium sp. CCBAU 53380]